VSLYNDNSLPAPIKDTYFNAVASLRGVASLHLQMDDQVLRFAFDNADVAALLPTKDELASWRAPVPPVTRTSLPRSCAALCVAVCVVRCVASIGVG
jgi:hypothetical protein